MPAKIARSTPRPSFGLPELPVAIHISRLASKDAAKSLLSTLVSESSGECRIKSITPVYVRDLGIEVPSGHLVTGHIIATDPRGQSLLPKNSATANAASFAKGEVVIYRVIRGTAEFKDGTGRIFELATGDVVTASKNAINLAGVGENTQILRLGLLKGIENLRKWTPTQRDEIDGLGDQIITRKDIRPQRTEGKPVGYLYE
jgi:hypothetical protein